jgi:hypothetical protein
MRGEAGCGQGKKRGVVGSLIGLAAGLALATGHVAGARAAAGGSGSPGAYALQRAAQAQRITGEVKSVQGAAGVVVVAKKLGDKALEIAIVADRETKITRGGASASFNEIKAGTGAAVVYVEKDGVNRAKGITLR